MAVRGTAPQPEIVRTLRALGIAFRSDPMPEEPGETRLRALERFAHELVDTPQGGTLLADGETILALSPNLAQTLGVAPEAIEGHHLRRFLAVRLFNGFLSDGRRARPLGSAFEIGARRYDGSPFLARCAVSLLHRSAINRVYAIRMADTGKSSTWRSRLTEAALMHPRLIELAATGWPAALRRRKTFPLWQSMELELHANCNRDCAWCPRHEDSSGVRKDAAGRNVLAQMPDGHVHRLIDEAADLGFRGLFKLHRLSDPFLDGRYLTFARHAKRRGLFLQEDTNGDVLRHDPALVEALDGLLDVVRIGLYDCHTVGALNDAVAAWRALFRRTLVLFNVPQWFCSIRAGASATTKPASLMDPVYLDYPCHQPYAYLMIRYDGRVCLCCADDAAAFDLGNAFETPLGELWWSKRHVQLARTLVSPRGRKAAAGPCASCYMDTVQGHLIDRDEGAATP